MTRPQPLALFEAPLDAASLIEASAGTGKTWTITGLYVRLLLEAELAVREILVVTFTEAATEELRDRIRRRLLDARDVLRGGAAKDEFDRSLLARFPDRERATDRLTNALRSFDEAAIYTIHGFCQRALADSAFEGARPFEMELIADEGSLVQEIADDFWRREFHAAAPAVVAHLLACRLTPEKLADGILRHVGKPFLAIDGPAAPPDLAQLERAYADAYARARALWHAGRDDITSLLRNAGLDGRKYQVRHFDSWFLQMDAFLEPERAHPAICDKLEKFTPAQLADAAKKGPPPRHPFFEACAGLLAAHAALTGALDAFLADAKVRLLTEVNRELAVRKERRRVQSYNDLLLKLAQALDPPGGDALARLLRARYRAALIDEFQDTDPVQFEIFRRIYGNEAAPVFFVGDPKQAIYSFRGADVFAYLAARATARAHYTLATNWRSTPELVRAVNVLFGRAARPFVFEDIAFHEAVAAKREQDALVVEEDIDAPLRFWFFSGENGKPLAKGTAGAQAARATAAEIARLLTLGSQDRARLGPRALAGGDIAVLVRKHQQGREVRDALAALGVPSVQHSQESVFETEEASELERVLLACAEPLREGRVAAALATEMLGMTARALSEASADPVAWEARLQPFDEYHRLWRDRGFIHMYRELLAREHVYARLLRLPDGERRMTNLLHLGELAHAAAHRERLGIHRLIRWFAEKRRRPNREDEEAQLRLESDADLVKIVTVHKSKGLQYPIVFCPYLWDGRMREGEGDAVVFHDPEQGYRAGADFGSTRRATRERLAAREELAENLRLLYVALTRARHRCYAVWGCIKDAGRAPLAWLLHPPADAGEAAFEAWWEADARDAAAMRGALAAIAEASQGAIAVLPEPRAGAPWQPAAPTPGELAARDWSRRIEPGPRMTSFSALTLGRDAELPDYDADAPVEPVPAAGVRDIHGFPRGTVAGQCLHAILERVDFQRADAAAVEPVARAALEAHGIARDWVPVVCDTVARVVATPLDASGLRLADVARAERVDEMEFTYPLARLAPAELRRVLGRYGRASVLFREEIESLSFAPLQGYMKGFIDLVFAAGERFYIADYKSNWLGAGRPAYAEERLPHAMAESAYDLQYLVYAVALHRHLGRHLPDYDYDRHFGGVFYLFLRGMSPEAGAGFGVFRDRPARELIEALDDYFRTGAVR